MPIRKMQWSPDTCGCVLEYARDDADGPVVNEEEYFLRAVETCEAHSTLAGAPGHHGQVMRENRGQKNKMMQAVVDLFPTLWVAGEDGSLELQGNRAIVWTFDVDRVLHVSLIGFNTNQKRNAQDWVDANIPGLVVVE